MRFTIRLSALAAAAILTLATPVAAQSREGVMGDLIRDISQVEKKMVDLAKVMPAAAHDAESGITKEYPSVAAFRRRCSVATHSSRSWRSHSRF